MRFLRIFRCIRGVKRQRTLQHRQKFVVRVVAEHGEFSLPGFDRFQGLTFDDQGEAEAYCRSANRLYSYKRYGVLEADS
jgi:hypothetical protein